MPDVVPLHLREVKRRQRRQRRQPLSKVI